MTIAAPIDTRFWSKAVPSGDCWTWIGHLNEDGYGAFAVDRNTTVRAHRFAYELLVGPIPDGLHLDHLCHTEDVTCPGGPTCRHRSCVNPYHADPVTALVNTHRGRGNGSQAACPTGHAYDATNTYEYRGRRYCRECSRLRKRAGTGDQLAPRRTRRAS